MTTETKSSSAGEMLAALRLRVQLWVLIVFMAVGFAGGFLVRGLAHDNSNQGVPAVSDQSGQQAPALSQDELNAGTLPAGHPDVGAANGATTTVPAQGGAPTTTPTTTTP